MMWDGVPKSGSPTSRWITSLRPAASAMISRMAERGIRSARLDSESVGEARFTSWSAISRPPSSDVNGVQGFAAGRELAGAGFSDHNVFLHHNEVSLPHEPRLRCEKHARDKRGVVDHVERGRFLMLQAQSMTNPLGPLQAGIA